MRSAPTNHLDPDRKGLTRGSRCAGSHRGSLQSPLRRHVADNLDDRMTFHVKTTVFEGSLDLLLGLISQHRLEITAVGLSQVVGGYLSHLEEGELNLEDTSEFLLMVSTLIRLKSQSLLPRPSHIEMEEESALIEERDRRLSRLLASVTFKDVAAVLGRRMQDAGRYVPRETGIDQKIHARPVGVDLPVDPEEMAGLANKVFAASALEPDLDHLDLDLPRVDTAIEDLRVRMERLAVSDFEELTAHCQRRLEVAAYFLALLEMARWGLIEVSQEDWLAGIEVRHLGGEIDLTPDWAS